MTRSRLAEWTRRYLPLEILATITALAGGLLAATMTANPMAIAFAGTWGENIGYYGLAFVREMRTLARDASGEGRTNLPVLSRSARVARRLIWEFGAAELIDSFVSRPFCMLTAGTILGSPELGIVVGKVVADLLFYAIAIAFYELGKRRQ